MSWHTEQRHGKTLTVYGTLQKSHPRDVYTLMAISHTLPGRGATMVVVIKEKIVIPAVTIVGRVLLRITIVHTQGPVRVVSIHIHIPIATVVNTKDIANNIIFGVNLTTKTTPVEYY